MKAFTLIEILLTIGLLAVLASVGFLSLSNFRGGQDLSIAAREVVAVLRDAESRATSGEGGQFWGVRFSNHRKLMTLFSGASCIYENPVSVASIGGNLEFQLPGSDDLDICFLKNTGYSSSASDVTITIGVPEDVNSTRTITIHPNGLIE